MKTFYHGCAARRVPIPGEDLADYEELHESLRQAYSPQEGIEEVVVHQLTSLTWRIRRLEQGAAMLEWYSYNCAETDYCRNGRTPVPR